MGTYIISTPPYGKVSILKQRGAEEITALPPWSEIETDAEFAYVCVIYNVDYEMAMIITSYSDILSVTGQGQLDQRPKVFLHIPRSKLDELPDNLDEYQQATAVNTRARNEQ
jgi:hypothetical protein